MTLPEESPKDVEFANRREIIEEQRANPIVRSRKTEEDFQITKEDLDPGTGVWKLTVFLRTFGLVVAVSAVLGLVGYLISLIVAPQSVISTFSILCGGALWFLLALTIPFVIASTAYVTHPTQVWGISRLGELESIKGPGRLRFWPFYESVYAVLDIPERTMYVPANDSVMRGLQGQSVIRISLNTTLRWKVGESEEDRMKLILNVTDAGPSVFRMAEGTVSGWMRARPFTALIETLSRRQMLKGLVRALRGVFPDREEGWYEQYAESFLNAVFVQPEMEGLAPHELEFKSPGEEMAERLKGKIADWGLTFKPFELSDVKLPPRMARFFERSEAIGEMVANIVGPLKAQFPNQEEDWYRDATLERLDNLIIYAEGERPEILKILGERGLGS